MISRRETGPLSHSTDGSRGLRHRGTSTVASVLRGALRGASIPRCNLMQERFEMPTSRHWHFERGQMDRLISWRKRVPICICRSYLLYDPEKSAVRTEYVPVVSQPASHDDKSTCATHVLAAGGKGQGKLNPNHSINPNDQSTVRLYSSKVKQVKALLSRQQWYESDFGHSSESVTLEVGEVRVPSPHKLIYHVVVYISLPRLLLSSR